MDRDFAHSITEKDLIDYIAENLPPADMARVEKAIRASKDLMAILNALILTYSNEEHSVGAIWQRHRLSCPTREQLSNFLLDAMPKDLHDYIEFHLKTVGCDFCQAELEDLKALKKANEKARGDRAKKALQEGVRLLQQQSGKQPRPPRS